MFHPRGRLGQIVIQTEGLFVRKAPLFLIALSLLIAQAAVAGPTRYVSDQLQITMRAGPGNQYKITKLLDSGTPLDVQQVGEDGWTLVRNQAGDEGWVLTRYLMDSPSARDQLQRTKANLAKLREETQQKSQSLGNVKQQSQSLQSQLDKTEAENAKLKQQLEEAAKGLHMAQENQDLKKQVIDLKRLVEDKKQELNSLKSRSDQRWFMVGALVLFGGIILGLILPRLRPRRRSGWGSGGL